MKALVHSRIAAGCILAAAIVLGMGRAGGPTFFGTAHAQSAAVAAPAPQTCAPRPGQIGLSRVVEIDTTRGPRFGLMQYADHDFLRDNEVVLTFDDGPSRKHTRLVLDALAAHCTKATFFMVGQMAVADPEMAREVARAGHTIALHTWSHRNLRATGTAAAEREIELGLSAVSRAIGVQVAPFFRFPYLADSQAMLARLSERNIAVFSIDADSKDFKTQNPREMIRVTLASLVPKKKGILLFHDIQLSTALGIRTLLDELATRGFKVVHVVAKTPAVTVASYDALADAELARRNKAVASNAMASRAVVWPMAQPGVPVEQFRPAAPSAAATTTQGAGAARGAARPVLLPTVAGGTPAAQQPAAAAPAAQQTTPPAGAIAPSADERPKLRGSADEDDWRKRVFGQ